MNFFYDLLSDKSKISSKRFISIYGLMLFTIVIISAVFGVSFGDTIIYALVSLILGSSAMTLVTNKNITSDETIKNKVTTEEKEEK